jgi:ribosomal-protein-alanine N-acetyltransferase
VSAVAELATLETVRLRLEPLSAAHADALYAIYREPAVRRFLITCPTTRADFDRIFARALECQATHGMWAITDAATGTLLGRIGYFAFGDLARPELAFLLAEASWGRGLATEAGSACLCHAFEHRPWNEVVAVVRPGNAAAIRVLGKLHLRPEQTVMLGDQPATLYQVSRDRFMVDQVDM